MIGRLDGALLSFGGLGRGRTPISGTDCDWPCACRMQQRTLNDWQQIGNRTQHMQ